MPEFILNVGLELPFILILLALLVFRRKVNPRASVLVKAPPDKVFALVDLHDGKVQNWNRTTVTSELVDVGHQVFRMTYVTTLSTGSQQSSEAYFRVAERRDLRGLGATVGDGHHADAALEHRLDEREGLLAHARFSLRQIGR